jgi:pimeloyl-ACP methyl ester carboxylesterase
MLKIRQAFRPSRVNISQTYEWSPHCTLYVAKLPDDIQGRKKFGWAKDSHSPEEGFPMPFLAQSGFRVVAHDRRGHGRSSQASSGNDMDGYADDLAAVIEALDLRDATLVGHSTGGGEVVRYVARHGTQRVAKVVLIAAVPPIMLKTQANPEGLPIDVFDGLRARLTEDRSQFYEELAIQFYGANKTLAQTGGSRKGNYDDPKINLGSSLPRGRRACGSRA